MAMAAKASAMKQRGIHVIDMSWGEPEFDTPTLVRERAKQALDEGDTHYTASAGLESLRKAIAAKLWEDNGLQYDWNTEILVTPGAKQAIYYALYAIIDSGDEVLTFEPGWLSYNDLIRMNGGVPVSVPGRKETNFLPDPVAIRERISPRTKAIVVNSPVNPTGAVWPQDLLDAVATTTRHHDLLVIADEIYDGVLYDDARHVSIASLQDMRNRTILINGFSKGAAMTGWRLGYAAAPKEILQGMLKVHQQIATCAGSFVQTAAVEAITKRKSVKEDLLPRYRRCRDMIVAGINSTRRFHCAPPQGAFYLMMNIEKLGVNAEAAACLLLEEARIATVPGTAYGISGEGHVRLSYAISETDLTVAIERLRAL